MPAKTKTEEIVWQVECLFAQIGLLELRPIQAHKPVDKPLAVRFGIGTRGEL